MSDFDTLIHSLYLIAAACFVAGLHLMNSPASARRGNFVSGAGMVLAFVTTIALLARDHVMTGTGLAMLTSGLVVGSLLGGITARRIQMTSMPQLVSLFNAVGGGAAALIAAGDAVSHVGSTSLAQLPIRTTLTTTLDLIIGGVTFSGSLVAGGKLAGHIPGRPMSFRGGRALNLTLAIVAAATAITYIAGHGGVVVLVVLTLAAIGLGILATLPIGGADMPVVISLLNAFTGSAVAMAGFVVDSIPLIIAGALVSAAGGILTKLMADAMNRSLGSIIAGGFGTGDEQGSGPVGATGSIREVSVDDAALQLAYARKVVIVPGYGLAGVRELQGGIVDADLTDAAGAARRTARLLVAGAEAACDDAAERTVHRVGHQLGEDATGR